VRRNCFFDAHCTETVLQLFRLGFPQPLTAGQGERKSRGRPQTT